MIVNITDDELIGLMDEFSTNPDSDLINNFFMDRFLKNHDINAPSEYYVVERRNITDLSIPSCYVIDCKSQNHLMIMILINDIKFKDELISKISSIKSAGIDEIDLLNISFGVLKEINYDIKRYNITNPEMFKNFSNSKN